MWYNEMRAANAWYEYMTAAIRGKIPNLKCLIMVKRDTALQAPLHQKKQQHTNCTSSLQL